MNQELARAVAIRELAALGSTIPAEDSVGFRLAGPPTTVFDINGEELFSRFPLGNGGHLDLAVNKDLGGPLLAVASDSGWNAENLLQAAHQRVDAAESRFVAYSYPKVGVQLMDGDREVAMLDLDAWEPVPEGEGDPFFRRWSLLEEIRGVPQQRDENEEAWTRRVDAWVTLGLDSEIEPPEKSELFLGPDITYFFQVSQKWCVAACVQMILEFHETSVTQQTLAEELGLIDKDGNKIALKDEMSHIQKIATVIDSNTTHETKSRIEQAPGWTAICKWLRTWGPSISLITGHARVLVGFQTNTVNGATSRLFRIYDPQKKKGKAWVSADQPKTRFASVTECKTHALQSGGAT